MAITTVILSCPPLSFAISISDWKASSGSTFPLYVLLLGDGDYDYRNITGKSKLKVPTIQIGGLNSYATDDRFVAFNGRIPEMATGRFPARTIEEVVNFN